MPCFVSQPAAFVGGREGEEGKFFSKGMGETEGEPGNGCLPLPLKSKGNGRWDPDLGEGHDAAFSSKVPKKCKPAQFSPRFQKCVLSMCVKVLLFCLQKFAGTSKAKIMPCSQGKGRKVVFMCMGREGGNGGKRHRGGGQKCLQKQCQKFPWEGSSQTIPCVCKC